MSEPTEPLVILINRSLPYNCVGKLTGRSGVEYGQSVYEEAYGAHVCRLPLSQWRSCKEDVTYGMQRRWCQWEVDIELADSPAGSDDVIGRIQNASSDQLDAIVSGLNPIVQAVHARDKELAGQPHEVPPPSTFTESSSPAAPHAAASSPSTGKHTAESLADAKWFTLVKHAKALDIDPNGFDGCDALRAAILAKQGGTQ